MRIALLILALGVILVGVLVRSEEATGARRLTYTMYKFEMYDRFRRAAGKRFQDTYNQRHPDKPIQVTYEPIGGNYVQKISAEIVAGTLQDLFFVRDFYQYADKGILLDLTPYVDKFGHRKQIEQIYQQLIAGCTYRGRLYGLPNNLNTVVLYYNRALFRRAGVAYPDETWDWNRMLDAAQKLTRRDAHGRALQFGLIVNVPWHKFALMNGAHMWDPTRSCCVINSPEAQQAVRFLKALYTTHRVSPNPQEERSLSGADSFKTSRAAMMLGGRWWTAVLKGLSDVDWAVAPLPRSLTGLRRSEAGFNVMGINARTRHPEVAYLLAMHLCSPENVRFLVEAGDSIPIRHGVEANAYFLSDPARAPGENRAYLLSMEDTFYEIGDIQIPLLAGGQIDNICWRWYDRYRLGVGDMSAEQFLGAVENELNALVEAKKRGVPRADVGSFAGIVSGAAGAVVIACYARRRLRNRATLAEAQAA